MFKPTQTKYVVVYNQLIIGFCTKLDIKDFDIFMYVSIKKMKNEIMIIIYFIFLIDCIFDLKREFLFIFNFFF